MTTKTLSRCPHLFLIACVTVGVILTMGQGMATVEDPVRESAICLDCHDGQDASLDGTAHTLGVETKTSGPRIACTDCHGANAKHWEEGPDEHPMINPSKLNAIAAAKLCMSCHLTSHQQNILEKNVHATNDVNCSACHSIHASDRHTTLLKKEEAALCYGCHPGVQGDFARSFRHPVSDGVITCSDCHMKLDETRRELSFNGTNICAGCHAEFHGPFPFEHQATLDYSTEEGGCLTCHAAHGSETPRILKQPYEPPHFQLCSQCHLVPGHNSNPKHGTRWSGLACNTCHTDIHGSYTNRFFLGESLTAEGCLKAGCHGY